MALRSELIAKIGATTTGFMSKMRGLGTGTNAIFAGIAASLGAAFSVAGIKKFLGFLLPIQTGIAEIQTIAQVSKERLRELEDEILGLGPELGILAKDSIPAVYQALSAGVDEKNVIDFLKIAGKAAIAGVTDVKTAVDGLTTVMNAFGVPMSEATTVADTFFEAIRLGKTTFPELATSIGQVAPLAASMGISFNEVAGAVATLTAKGASTSEAITRIRGAMTAIIKPSGDMQTALDGIRKKYGEAAFEGFSFQKKLQLIREAAGGSNEKLAAMIGRAEALVGVLALTGDSADKAAKDLEAMKNSAGAAETAFGTMDETTAQAFKRIQGSAEEMANKVGREALPVIAEELDKILVMMNRLSESGDMERFADRSAKALSFLARKVGEFIAENEALEGGIGAAAAKVGATGSLAQQKNLIASLVEDAELAAGPGGEVLSLAAAKLPSELEKAEIRAKAGIAGDVAGPTEEEVAKADKEEAAVAALAKAAEAARAAAQKQKDAADKQKQAADKQKENAEQDKKSAETMREAVSLQRNEFNRALKLENDARDTAGEVLAKYRRGDVLGQFDRDFLSGRIEANLSGKLGKMIQPLVNTFGAEKALAFLKGVGDTSALNAAGKLGDGGAATAAQVSSLFTNVETIKNKVDKMAGLTGN